MPPGEDQNRLRRTTQETREETPWRPEDDGPNAGVVLACEKRAGGAPARSGDTERYRPLHRGPMAVLHVFDDGLKSSESIRVRVTPFVIGREEGDLVLPHDPLMSARHAAIECTLGAEHPQWKLRDLDSSNGTFVQAKQSLLEPGREISIARRRFRFCPPETRDEGSEEPERESDVRRTIPWSSLMKRKNPEAAPSLVELLPDREGRRFPLSKSEQWIGRASKCEVLLDDPTVSPRHARVLKTRDGKWCVEDADSMNGLWVRVASLPLSSGAFFMLGEQVFLITLP